MNCHRLLQRIVVLETKLLAGLRKQVENTADRHHRPPQHTAGESCESQQFIPIVEEQAETDPQTNRWHKQGARSKRHAASSSNRLWCEQVQSFISGPLPARGTNMISRLLGLNTWLQRSSGLKGVNFFDNFNIFWGHRQLFKLDGLHPNKLGARVLKDNIYFSLHHPSLVCANGQSMSGHRTSYQLQSHHVVDIS